MNKPNEDRLVKIAVIVCLALMTAWSGAALAQEENPVERKQSPAKDAQDSRPDKKHVSFLVDLLARKPLEIADDEDELRKLLKQRLNVAIEEFCNRHSYFQSGMTGPRDLYEASNRLYEAELSLAANSADRISVIQKHLKAMTEFHAGLRTLVDAGAHQAADLRQMEFHRLTLEIDLLQAKTYGKKGGDQ